MEPTDSAVRAAKPAEKSYKLFDGRGLFLLVTPSGGLLWRFKYQFEGREKLISLGQSRAVYKFDLRRAPNLRVTPPDR